MVARPATKELLNDIEYHCNNFFNPRNIAADPERYYPDAFLELAGRIQQYSDNPANFNGSDSDKPVYSSWQTAFKKELSIYKKAKFI